MSISTPSTLLRNRFATYGVKQLPSMIFQTGYGVQFMTVGTLSEEDVTSDMKQIVREHAYPITVDK